MHKEIRWSFSDGKKAWKVSESRVMLRYSRDVLGHAVFSRKMGTRAEGRWT